jgi:hypothetical protein
LRIESGGEALQVEVAAAGQPFAVRAETVDEDLPRALPHPTRIAIALDAPASDARVTLRITPLPR